ncbi:MAG: hypothetical protein V2A73_19050 [Pseudomonadota bacterium]
MRTPLNYLFAGLLLGAGFLVLSPVEAQAGGMGVTPTTIDFKVKKSGDYLPPIKISNDDTQPWNFSLEIMPLTHNDSGAPTVAPASYQYRGDNVLVVKPEKFSLPAGQTKEVRAQVVIPKGRVGGAYAVVYVLGKPAKDAGATNVGANVRVGVIVEVKLPGESNLRIGAESAYATQEKPDGPVKLNALATNLGNVHDSIGGSISITSAAKEIARIPIAPATVLPGAARILAGSWTMPKNIAPGKYKLTANLTAPAVANAATAFGELEVLKAGEIVMPRAVITKLTAPPSVQKKPIIVEASVLNRGNAPLTPTGKVAFTNEKGQEVAFSQVVVEKPILPGKREVVKAGIKDGLPPGRYEVALILSSPTKVPLAAFATSMQVIEKEVTLGGEIVQFVGPKGKDKFFVLDFENKSNVEVDAEGIVMVADSNNNVVGQVPLTKKHLGVGGKASFQYDLPEGLDSGLYELRATLNYGGPSPAVKTVKHFVQ